MDLCETGYEGGKWIGVAQNHIKGRVLLTQCQLILGDACSVRYGPQILFFLALYVFESCVINELFLR